MKIIALTLSICLFGPLQSTCEETNWHPKEHNVLILIKSWAKEAEDSEKLDSTSIVFPDSVVINFSKYNNRVDEHEHINDRFVSNNQQPIIEQVSLSSPNSNYSHKNYNPIHNLTKDTSVKEENIVQCTKNNQRFPVTNKCDGYMECQNGIPEDKQCPDGLRFNINSNSASSPCSYPIDVDCKAGATLQTPIPTKDCPNQFGYFKTEDRYNCSSFRICENGVGSDFTCPDGLAFNIKNYRCEWPDLVPHCNVEALFRFRCPKISVNQTKYRSSTDCAKYYVCIDGKPRRLECNEFYAFDQTKQKCVPAYEVEECTTFQKYVAEEILRRISNGEYKITNDDGYIDLRATDINFSPKIKNKSIII